VYYNYSLRESIGKNSLLRQDDLFMSSNGCIAVVGAGLVGCVQALFLAKQSFKVDLYEKREDVRKIRQRNINLMLSMRAWPALRAVGLEDMILDNCFPLYSHLIHGSLGDINRQRW